MSKTKPKIEGDADARRPDDDMRRRVERLEEELKAQRKSMDDADTKQEMEW